MASYKMGEIVRINGSAADDSQVVRDHCEAIQAVDDKAHAEGVARLRSADGTVFLSSGSRTPLQNAVCASVAGLTTPFTLDRIHGKAVKGGRGKKRVIVSAETPAAPPAPPAPETGKGKRGS